MSGLPCQISPLAADQERLRCSQHEFEWPRPSMLGPLPADCPRAELDAAREIARLHRHAERDRRELREALAALRTVARAAGVANPDRFLILTDGAAKLGAAAVQGISAIVGGIATTPAPASAPGPVAEELCAHGLPARDCAALRNGSRGPSGTRKGPSSRPLIRPIDPAAFVRRVERGIAEHWGPEALQPTVPRRDLGRCICGGEIEPVDEDWARCRGCGDSTFPISDRAAGLVEKVDPGLAAERDAPPPQHCRGDLCRDPRPPAMCSCNCQPCRAADQVEERTKAFDRKHRGRRVQATLLGGARERAVAAFAELAGSLIEAVEADLDRRDAALLEGIHPSSPAGPGEIVGLPIPGADPAEASLRQELSRSRRREARLLRKHAARKEALANLVAAAEDLSFDALTNAIVEALAAARKAIEDGV